MTSVDDMDEAAVTLVAALREATAAVAAFKSEHRAVWSVVSYEMPVFSGFGIVREDDGCYQDCLPVQMEGGDVFWCPLERTVAANEPSAWPSWIKKEKKIK